MTLEQKIKATEKLGFRREKNPFEDYDYRIWSKHYNCYLLISIKGKPKIDVQWAGTQFGIPKELVKQICEIWGVE